MSWAKTIAWSTPSLALAAVATAAAVPVLLLALRRVLLGKNVSPQEFTISCTCGRVRASVHAAAPLHLACHCDDCQDYVAWVALRRPAELQRLLTADDNGAVRTVQVFKREVVVSSGADLLQITFLCPRLVPAGRPFQLLRAHANCCGTPLFNTWRDLPSISFFAAAAEEDGKSGAAALREPPEWRLNTKWSSRVAHERLIPTGTTGFSPFFLLRFVSRNWFYAQLARPEPFCLDESVCTERGRAASKL